VAIGLLTLMWQLCFFCLYESICRFGSCCDLHQNRFSGQSLCYIDDIVFVVVTAVVVAVDMIVVVVLVAAAADSSALDNHVAH
jgi:hypothetical protein